MFEIVWSEKAESEYLNTLQYWISHNKSSDYSEKIIIDVEEQENIISENPNIGKLMSYRNVRKIKVLKHFSLIYKTEESKIEILSFWDNRRSPENLKL